ncbi:MAG: hypothetical protein CMC00_03425 [Flavobacteriaceae bacterium]|nr:hypothetical protein [Flavobacteriaceae bacterium]
MKAIYTLLILLIPFFGFGQQTFIPDDNFEQALIDLGLDDIIDDYVYTSSIDTITQLHLLNQNIADLTGIENFFQLTYLDCRYNSLTSLDVSNNLFLENLYCNNNQITEIDLINNDSLNWLQIAYNDLSSLDVSMNEKLEYLSCEFNNLINLDVNDSLKELRCFFNEISTLSISNNHNLTYIACNNNEILSLDLSDLYNLDILYCSDNLLIELDLRNGFNSTMTEMIAYNNPFLSCINVDDVEWSENNWISENYNIDDSIIFSLDCQNEDINIEGQWFTNINDYVEISSDSFIIFIFENEDCYELEEYTYTLDDSLILIYEDNNPIIIAEIINLTSNSFSLTFEENTIDLNSSTFEPSKWVECDEEISWYCFEEYCYEELGGLGEFNSLEECQFECVSFNEEKTYIPDDYFEQALIELGYDNILDDSVLTSNISSISELDISNKNISDLTGIQDFIFLYHLECNDNQLYSLDISCPMLEYLNCDNNLIDELNIESSNLVELRCSNNPLTFFSGETFPLLTILEIYNTEIYSIDLSQSILLNWLSIGSNPNLLNLDLSSNYNIDFIDLWSNSLFELDLRNGNNQIITYFVSINSQNLICISVDDVSYSYENWTNIDSWTYFSDDCNPIQDSWNCVNDACVDPLDGSGEFSTLNDCEQVCQNISSISENLIDVNIYPNPSSNIFNLELKSDYETEILVTNILGEQVYFESTNSIGEFNTQIDLSNHSKGIYNLTIKTSDGLSNHKLILQ